MMIRGIIVVSMMMVAVPGAANATDVASEYRAAVQSLRSGDVDGAVRHASLAIQMQPSFARAYGVRAIAFQARGMYDQAIADTTKAIVFDPNDAVAFNNRGSEHAARGEHALALADYNHAIALRPDLPEAYMGRGTELGNIGNYEGSIADLQKAVELRPNYADAHQNLGASLEHVGRRDDAQAEYRSALALRPDLPQAREAVARSVGPAAPAETQASAPSPVAAPPHPTLISAAPPAPPPAPSPSVAGQPPLLASATDPLPRVTVAPLQQGQSTLASAAVPPPHAAMPPRFSERPLSVNFASGPDRPHDVAVIIGNADYSKFGKDIPDDKPAYADAAGIKLYAKQVLGIHEENIIFIRDATSAQMVTVFGNDKEHRGKLFDYVKPGVSRVFIYYSGHGAPATSREGSPYLVPADADPASLELSGYSLATLFGNVGKLPADTVTVVLEACFSGQSPGGSIIRKASPIHLIASTPGIPRNVTVISAGTGDQMASWEKDDSDGLFTKYFLLGMSGDAAKKPYGPGYGQVTLAELDSYLKDTVTYYARRYYGRDQVVQIIKAAGT